RWKACSASRTSLGLSSTSRISTSCSFIDVAPAQREGEGGPALDLGLGPRATAVAMDHALHDRQPHPGALVLLGAVQPLEDAEELVGVLHVESDPVVPDVVGGLA